jgi:tripartite-type tricarboxylate transporter receptor subunit TctC
MKSIRTLLLALAVAPLAVAAQSYPAKPVRMVLSFPAGGPTDLSARLIAGRMSQSMGQNVLTDNRAGAGGIIAATAVAKAPADGYTILFTPLGTHILTSVSRTEAPYHPIKDFTPLCHAIEAATAGIMATRALQAGTIRELIDLAKREPGKLTYASAGNGTQFHLTGELFKQAAGVDITHVPYKGAAQSAVDLQSGQVTLSLGVLQPLLPLIRSGKIKALAIIDSKTFAALPDVPPITEALPNFRPLDGGLAFFAPPGLARPLTDRLNGEFTKATHAPDVKTKLEEGGAIPMNCGSVEEFSAKVQRSMETYRQAMKLAGVKPE